MAFVDMKDVKVPLASGTAGTTGINVVYAERITASIDTTSTGGNDAYTIPPGNCSTTVVVKVNSTASCDLEMCVDEYPVYLAGNALWVPVTGMTAITAGAVKYITFNTPVTAFRLNVKTALAGTQGYISIAVIEK